MKIGLSAEEIMKILNTNFDTLPELHPLREHSDWIHKVWESRDVPDVQVIPSPTLDPSQQALSIFSMILYIAKIRNWKLFEAGIEIAATDNSFALAQIVRASFENAGWLGCACHYAKDWPPHKPCDKLKNLLTGTRESGDETQSVNILTCLEKADRVLREALPDVDLGDWIKDFHALVSEFVHPNFDSNFSEIELIDEPQPILRLSAEITRLSLDSLLKQLRFAGFAFEQLHRIASNKIKIG